jgi:aminoglycoside phosphotransferase
VVDWFFRDLFVPHGRRERLLRRAVRLAGRLPVSLAALFRDRRLLDDLAAAEARADALAAVEWLVAGPGRPLLAEGGVAATPSWLAAADYAGTGRRRTLAFLFAAGSDRPAAMAKVRPADAAGEPLATEREAIDRVRAELPAGLAATVPAVLAWRRAAGREGLLLAALPGRSVWAELHAAAFPARLASRHLSAAAAWLAAFHAATHRTDAYRLPGWDELAAGEPVPPSWYRRLAERLERRPLPLAAGHGDFWPRNVLVEGGEVTAVVDWEAARRAAPPFADLFAFAWSYGMEGPWRRGHALPLAEAFRRAFLDDNPLSRAVAAYFARYGSALGLDGETARDLFRLWLRTRQADDPEGGENWRICDRMLGEAERSAFSG